MEFKKKLKITYLYLKRRVAKCRARLRPVIGRRRGERSRVWAVAPWRLVFYLLLVLWFSFQWNISVSCPSLNLLRRQYNDGEIILVPRSEAWRTKVLSRVAWDIARSMLAAAAAAAAGSNTVHERLRMTDSTHCANWWETYRLSACVAVPISAPDGENPAQ